MAYPSDIKFARLTGAFGTCRTIKAYRDGEEIGDSYLSAGEPDGPAWFIGAFDQEATLRVDLTKSNEQNYAAVEAALLSCIARADVLRAGRAA